MANINIKLNKNFTTQFNKMVAEYGEEFCKLNGFADSQLSYTDFIDNFIDTETVADSSVDGSANVKNKDTRTLMNEMPKPHRKLLAFNKIYYELNKKYGFKTANEWLRAEWTKALYMHDADTATFVHYCFAYDLKDLAEKGLFFLDTFNYEAPKHLETFVDFVKEYISFVSNRSSGACGLPNLIPYMYYFWKKDVEEGYYVRTPDYHARQHIQRFIYAVNQPYVRDGIQSAFTNVSVFDGPYLEALFGGAEFPDGTFMIDHLDEIKEFQKIFMEVVADIRERNMFTYPVLTISLLRKNGKFEDEDFARWGIQHNMRWSDSNIFIDDSVTSLSNCCRLKSNIEDLGYFNSVGGTALKVGSVKVSTINLARIALEHKSEQGYLVALRDMVELDCKALDVVRHIIQRNVEKGLLPNFSHGLVDFEHLYNTVGVIGIYETMKEFGYTREDEFGNVYYTEDADRFGKKIFEVLHRTKDQFALDKDYKINCEQIPGESCAAKMQEADELLYPEEVNKDLPLYGNQFIPLGIQTTLQERIRIASLFDSYCNGGSIAHINIESPFANFEQAWDLVNYIADQGLTYFAFNIKIQACKHNHAFFGKICPICGEPVDTEYTRIVGFYTPIKTWSTPRKAEVKMREWIDINGKN
jgi:ribonucleoside-triphosphate reductase